MAQDYKNEFRKSGLTVEVKNNNITKAWRKLKRLMQDEGINQELRERQYYEKPSVKKKREKAQAKRRWEKRKAEMEANW